MKRLLFIPGVLLLFATEILRVYFIMPFPGSQQADTIGLAALPAYQEFWHSWSHFHPATTRYQ